MAEDTETSSARWHVMTARARFSGSGRRAGPTRLNVAKLGSNRTRRRRHGPLSPEDPSSFPASDTTPEMVPFGRVYECR